MPKNQNQSNNIANFNKKGMLTAIFSQPRTDWIQSSIFTALFAARKLNYIIIYIRHYKIFKKQRKLQLYTIKN